MLFEDFGQPLQMASKIAGPWKVRHLFMTLTDLYAALPLMTLVLPLLAAQCDFVGGDLRRITVSTVLNLATRTPAAFKQVLGRLRPDERMKLENVLRIALEKKQDVKHEEESKPSISLKLDFASIE